MANLTALTQAACSLHLNILDKAVKKDVLQQSFEFGADSRLAEKAWKLAKSVGRIAGKDVVFLEECPQSRAEAIKKILVAVDSETMLTCDFIKLAYALTGLSDKAIIAALNKLHDEQFLIHNMACPPMHIIPRAW